VSDNDERRADVRTEDHPVKELKILFESETPGLLGRNVSASTVDVSATGLGISLNCNIPVDSTLDMRVTL